MREHPATLQTQAVTAERIWTADDFPVLTTTCSLPQPEETASAVTHRIRRYYQAQGQAFMHYCQYALLPLAAAEYRSALAASAPLPCFHAELHYEVTRNENSLWSLYTESSERVGDTPTLHIRHGDTWDLATGYPIEISSLFPPRSKWKRALLRTAAETIERQERCGIAKYNSNWRSLLHRRFYSKNFYLTSEGLCYFFPMYAIAPAAEGIPTFTLPYGTEPLPDLNSITRA